MTATIEWLTRRAYLTGIRHRNRETNSALRFRDLLSGLREWVGRSAVLAIGGFDAVLVSTHFGTSIKQASNGLRRLHQMGFLGRKRARRACISSKTGKLCNKGYKYIYRLRKQGISYAEWLKTGKPLEDFAYSRLTFQVMSYLPQDLRDTLSILSLSRSAQNYHGPSRNLRLLDNNLVPVCSLVLQNQALQSENRKLQNENAILQLQKGNFEDANKRLEGERGLVYNLLARAIVDSAIKNNLESNLDLSMQMGRYWRRRATTYENAFGKAETMYYQLRRDADQLIQRWKSTCEQLASSQVSRGSPNTV